MFPDSIEVDLHAFGDVIMGVWAASVEWLGEFGQRKGLSCSTWREWGVFARPEQTVSLSGSRGSRGG